MTHILFHLPKVSFESVFKSLPQFWQDILCSCEEGFHHNELSRQQYESDRTGPWRDSKIKQFPEPAKCSKCGGFIRTWLCRCDSCNDIYYSFFRHPRRYFLGAGKGTSGCWHCLTKRGFAPFVNYASFRDPMRNMQQAAPPDCVIPPVEISEGDPFQLDWL